MPGDMSGEGFAVSVPPAVTLGPGLKSGPLAVVSHHAIWFEFEQIFRVEVLRVLERPTGQADRGQRQRPGHIRNGVFDPLGGGRAGNYQRDNGKLERQNYFSSY